MPRILRSQGIYKLGKPVVVTPAAAPLAPPLRTRLAAVNAARAARGRYPSDGWSPWATTCFQVLDDFNRPDEGPPPSASWRQPIDPADSQPLEVVSNQCENTGAGFASGYWNEAAFGPDCGVFFTLRGIGDHYAFARVQNAGTAAFIGYAADFTPGSTDIFVVALPSYTLIAQFSAPTALSVGDQVGFTVAGSTITVFVNSVPVGSVIDGTYPDAGYIGVDLNTDAAIDDFGGGNLASTGGWRAPIMGLRPPAVLCPAQPLASPIRSRLVPGRRPIPRTRLQPPAVITQPATFEGPRAALVRIRPVYPTYRNSRQPLVEVDVIQLTIRVVEARTRPRRTTTVLRVTIVPVAFTAPPLRIALTHIRPRHTTTRLSPPAVVAPRPLAPPPQSRLVRTRPRHTVYRLQRPTTLAVFPGPRSSITRVRPRPTTTILVPAQVVRNPHVEQQLRTLRVRLVRARPQPTSTLLRPPAVVIITPPTESDIHVTVVRGRRPKTTYRLFRPATLEPYSVQLRERTLRVQLVRVRPRKTTLKLRPPTRVAVLTFSAGKPVLVRSRPERTVTTLRGPVVLRTFSTGETRLVTTRPRHTTTLLRPPAVVRQRPQVTQIRAAFVTARPRPTTRLLRPPAVLRVFTGPVSAVVRIRPRHTTARLFPPAVVTPFVAPAVAFIRSWLTRIRPPGTLWQLFPPRRLRNVPGEACLTDHAKFDSCLTDQAAAEACLEDAEVATEACLTNQAAYQACLVDMSAATATLRDEE